MEGNFVTFVERLLQQTKPAHVDMNYYNNGHAPLGPTGHTDTLVSLRLTVYPGMDVPDYNSLRKLESLTLLMGSGSGTPVTVSLLKFYNASALRYLDISAATLISDLDALSTGFASLEELHLGTVEDGCSSPLALPSTLTTLSIATFPWNPCTFSVASTNTGALTSLTFKEYFGNFSILPNGLPSSLRSLTFLDAFHDLYYLPDLTYLRLESVSFGTGSSLMLSDFISDALCEKLTYTSIRKLFATSASAQLGDFLVPIPCLQDMTSLSSVSLVTPSMRHISQLANASFAQITSGLGSGNALSGTSAAGSLGITELRFNRLYWHQSPEVNHPNIDLAPSWSWFVSAFPNLVTLEYFNCHWNADFPGTEFKLLKQLERLTLQPDIPSLNKRESLDAQGRLTGTIPSDFFLFSPNLRYFDVSWGQLNGTIPWFGLERLRTLNLIRNEFNEWPSLNLTFSSVPGYGPPSQLEYVNLAHNPLIKIPDDASWETMAPSLKEVNFANIEDTKQPFPRSLFSARSAVRRIDSSYVVWTSSFPPFIEAPNLRILNISVMDICGGLPDIVHSPNFSNADVPLVHLNARGIETLQGTLPAGYASYFDNLDFYQTRGLIGTLPGAFDFFAAESSNSVINLAQTPITGNMFALTELKANRDYFDVRGTGLQACTVVPNTAISGVPPPSACQCAYAERTAWSNYCDGFASYCSGTPVVVAAPGPPAACEPFTRVLAAPAIPSNLTPTNSCPPPRPSPAFQCVGDQWIAMQGVVGSTIVIPPNVVTYVSGNLTITSSLEFRGSAASLKVDGCVYLTKNRVTVDLSGDDVNRLLRSSGKLKHSLLKSNSTDCAGSTDLTITSVEAKKRYGGCYRVTAERSSTSSKGELVVIFSVDRKLCNLAIAIPVVVGCILILAGVLAFVIWKRQKRKFGKHIDDEIRDRKR